tara:strand:+ start:56 stop:214 length:159 start_codon:yes stop_codon:yes gene_type:complete
MIRTQEEMITEKDRIISICLEMCKNAKGQVKYGFQTISNFLSDNKIGEKEAS